MKLARRRLLAFTLASPVLLTLLGASPEALPRRKATFTYSSRDLKMRIAIPDMLRTSDKQAMKMLDGGYPTTLVYDLAVFARGARSPRSHVHVEISVQWDPWNQDYIVQTTIDGGAPSVRRYALRSDAIKASTSLFVTIDKVADIPRGEQAVHYVHVVAQRNPTSPRTSGTTTAARGQDRDLEMFSRWVGMFVRTRAQADKVVEFRTHPFYVPEFEAEPGED
jgi:hypothetical protein